MPPKFKRKFTAFIARLRPRLPLIGGFFLLIVVFKLLSSGLGWLQMHGLTTGFLKSVIYGNSASLVKAYQGRTNILLLGISGADHPGRDLTDTMIVASMDLKTADVLLISLPRDIWSPTLQDKINSAYHYGEEKKAGGGFILAKSIAEEVTGQPLHYIILVDFAGFKKAIDVIGGITVDVPETFVDKRFPLRGKENDNCSGDPDFACRYETVRFRKGRQLMDGATALKYVRSRNAEGRQGTDFARSQRQQQVLLAFKEKVTTWSILANPVKIKALYAQFKRAVKTDAQLSELLALARVAVKLNDSSIRKLVLDAGDKEQGRSGWLYHPPVSRYGRWVLLPRSNSFKPIHQLVSCYLASPACKMQPEDY